MNTNFNFSDPGITLTSVRETLESDINEIKQYLAKIHKWITNTIFSKQSFFYSFAILIMLISIFYFNAASILRSNTQVGLSIIEGGEMLVNLLLVFFILLILTWNFYLFFYLCVFKLEHNKELKFPLVDSSYFNPTLYVLAMYFFRKAYLLTNIDKLTLIYNSSMFGINFYFTYQTFHYIQNKIHSITITINREENFKLIHKFRYAIIFYVVMNLFHVIVTMMTIEETELLFQVLVIMKGVYLFLRQIEFWKKCEVDITYLHLNICEKEKVHMENFKTKTKFELLPMLCLFNVVLITLIFAAYNSFLYNSSLMLILIVQGVDIYRCFSTYKRVLLFDRKMNEL